MSLQEIPLRTDSRTTMIDITSRVKQAITADDISEGIVIVSSPHTTAGITINENADPSVKSDMIRSLNKLIPFRDNYEHMEGNSDAHIKTTLTGLSVTVPISEGRLVLGTWQGIYFCEYDGPRNRKFMVKTIRG